jgi:HEPN domain-containing protein
MAVSGQHGESSESSEQPGIDVERVSAFWPTEADEALQVAGHLVEKADYSYALFFGHLAIEKLLKGLHAARVRKHAPRIHNLHRLARSANLEVDQKHADAPITVTAFNLEARYPDIGSRFREKCTPEYTAQQMVSIKELFGWLRSQIP